MKSVDSPNVQDAAMQIMEMGSAAEVKAFLEGETRAGVMKAAKERLGELVLSGGFEDKAEAGPKGPMKFYSVMVPPGQDKNSPKTVPITIINEAGFEYRGVIRRGQKVIHNLPEHAMEVLRNAQVTEYQKPEDALEMDGIVQVNKLVKVEVPSYPFVQVGESYAEKREA